MISMQMRLARRGYNRRGTWVTKLCFVIVGMGAGSPVSARPLTPTDLVSLSRISHPAVSADGHWLVWDQRETDLQANNGRHDLWRLDLTVAHASPRKIAIKNDEEGSRPAFGPDGRLYYIATGVAGTDAVWAMPAAGGTPERVTGDLGIQGFRISPLGNAILVWADRPVGAKTLAMTKTNDSAGTGGARVYDQLPIRFWNTWTDGRRSQLFVLPLVDGCASGPGHAIEGGLIGDVPSKPSGGEAEVAWSGDGRTVYFALREAGRIEPMSTNVDVFATAADGSVSPTNLTRQNKATDTRPTISPNGRWLAWLASVRPGYENDRQVLMLRDLATGASRAVTARWDRTVDSVQWLPDSSALYVTAQDGIDHPLFLVDTANGHVERLTAGGYVDDVVVTPSGEAIFALDSLVAPADFWRVSAGRHEIRLTSVNQARLAGVDWPAVRPFAFRGADGEAVSGLVLVPLRSGAKLPVLMVVHGGPQNVFGDRWSSQLNAAIWTGWGTGVVAINYHGSTGFGQRFTDSVINDWGGHPLTDLKLGLAAALDRFRQLDGSRVCAVGGSYGGFMMNWIEGHWPDRFRCLIQADGPFDLRAMTYETDDLRADEWDFGDQPYHQKPAMFERWNPVHGVQHWRTPMLLFTGERDFRTPSTQAVAAFTALQQRNVPARLVVFPDEGHSILKPKNNVRWYSEIYAWLTRYIFDKKSATETIGLQAAS